MHTCNMVNTHNALLGGKHVQTLTEWNSKSNTSLQNAIIYADNLKTYNIPNTLNAAFGPNPTNNKHLFNFKKIKFV